MTVETLLQEARGLPQNEQLLLASLLIQQAQTTLPSGETKREVLRRVRGMFRGIPSTTKVQAEKRRELEEEDRKLFEDRGRRGPFHRMGKPGPKIARKESQ